MKKLILIISILLCLVGCYKENDKLLKLNHLVDYNELENAELIEEKHENLFIGKLPEVERKMYNNETYLDNIINYIRNNFNININDRWEYVIHYYNEEKTEGMIQFTYMIGEIRSNKNITFGYYDGYIKEIFYKCLDKEVDEEDLIERVKKFKDNYHQEKIVLKEGEKFKSEESNYSYFYNVDKLVYSYVVYFTYDGVINNDNATSYYIDKVGNAVK